MTKILDQHGQPIDRAVLSEPQTSRIAALQNQYLTPMLGGLTPARVARILQGADNGDLLDQHRLFADMEERDGHLRAEMDKRKNAIVRLDWRIEPQRNATAAEKAAAQWVQEVLTDAVDPVEDLLLSLMEGVGHGFAPVELEWRKEGKELLPSFAPRPHEWFRLDQTRTHLRLADVSIDGLPLMPFGWVMHTHGKAKTGYGGRLGLHRTLVWPFLYKAYALGDFAEFLETYGLPIIVGKYFTGATADEKASLMRAVTALGHDARAIMPKEMEIDIQSITGSAGESAHLQMMQWADKSESKSILGQTLSADTGSKGGGSFALGKVHNEVRHDITEGDARQIAATITRDLVYPLIALNRGGVDSLARCPRFMFDTSEPADLSAYADALPKLVAAGVKIPVGWAQEKLHIPQPKDGEEVLTVSQPVTLLADPAATLSASIPAGAVALNAVPVLDPTTDEADQLDRAAAVTWSQQIESIKSLVDQATDLNALQKDMVAAFGGKPQDELVKLMGAAFALAELKGMVDLQEGR